MKKVMLVVLMAVFTTFVIAQDKKEVKPVVKKETTKTEAVQTVRKEPAKAEVVQPVKKENVKPVAPQPKKKGVSHKDKKGETPVNK